MHPSTSFRRHDTAADRLPESVRRSLDEDLVATVVVVDDDPVTRRLFPRLLVDPWRVEVCESADVALEAVARLRPVAVIADRLVPGGDGVDFLSEVARLWPATRRVLMGGPDDRRSVVRAINEAGLHRFLAKPLEATAVQDVLDGALAARRRERAVELLLEDVRTSNRELERARRALEERQAHLLHSERLAVLGRLTQGLARGIRPLLSELRDVERELRGWTLDPEEDELLAMGHDAVEAVWDIIDDISRFTRHGGLVIERAWVDGEDLVRRAVRFASFDRRLRDRVLTVEVAPAPAIHGDARRLRQVLLNLLRNAADATAPGARIEVALAPRDGEVEIRVTDEGCGMSPEVARRVFDEFFSTKGEAGLGLGLALCRSIVEQHGGALTCTSAPGAGTTFRVRLPTIAPAG